MEDAHSVKLGYADDPDSSYFAVFDGHGGAKFADYCSLHLSQYLQNNPAFSMTSSVYISLYSTCTVHIMCSVYGQIESICMFICIHVGCMQQHYYYVTIYMYIPSLLHTFTTIYTT